MPPDKAKLEAAITKVADYHQADILLCNSGMDRGVERQVVTLCRKRTRRENVVLIVVTSGGDADVAFRIARHLQSFYSKFTCIVSGWCKSAGTLLALGANEVAFGIHGELGPLDVQMAKKDELLDVESGLTVMTALTALHEKTLSAFQHFFIETTIGGAGRISVKTASEIAVGLATGIFAPISEQIDPIHIGEAFRSMAIAVEYGQRLIDASDNAKPGALDKLISGYPSHGFVIDRIEARTIFKQTRECTDDEQALLDLLEPLAIFPASNRLVRFLNERKQDGDDDDNDEASNDDAKAATAAGADAASGQQGDATTQQQAGKEQHPD